MATLVLATAGAWAGSAMGFGAIGVIAGRAVGALAGAALDGMIFGGTKQHVEGPRLDDLRVMGSAEGSVIPRVYGTVRLAGQMIWATNLIEETETSTTTQGGKGGGSVTTTTTTYRYYANFAVGLCEGQVASVIRIWADGKPMDTSQVTWRLHRGTEDQLPDPLISSVQGVDATPAYRGLAYVVFERLPLERYGNRIPQLSFEVVRPVDRVLAAMPGVCIIPGSGEFYCDPDPVWRAGEVVSVTADASSDTDAGTDTGTTPPQIFSTDGDGGSM